MSDFFLACEEGNLEKVEEFIGQGYDVNKRDDRYHGYGRTPLMYAAGEGRYDVVKCLIDHGADVSQKNFANRTLLHYASEGGNLKVVELILSTSKGAQIDEEDSGHRTPLMLAAGKGHSDVLLCLIDHGVDVNKRDCNERTALHCASENGHLEVSELLVSKGAEIDVEDGDHCTPLMLAAKRGHYDVSEHLISQGADIHKKDGCDRTALHYASESGHLEIVELLLSKGSEIDREDKDHCTPLILAAERGHNDVSLNFINHDADIHKKDGRNRTALHHVSQRGQLNIVELLLSKGAEIDVEDVNHHTPLLLAAEKGHNDVSLYLINHGANVCKKDGRNRTALHYASERDQLNIVELLLSKGADIDIEDENRRTPLLLAAERGYNDVLLYLINHGADINRKNYLEQTALHYASRRGDLKVVELLLSKGAEMDVEDEDLRTPMTVAVTYKKFDIMYHLITAGASVKRLADFNIRNLGREALSHAIHTDRIPEARVLITNGVGIEGQLGICLPRTTLLRCIENDCVSLVKHLFPGDVRQLADCRNKNAGRVALSHVIRNNYIALASELITNGVGIREILDICPPRTALMWCAENGHASLVRHLILQGVDVDHQDDYDRSALHFAAESDSIQCGNLLVEAGANVRLGNKASATPLDIASNEFKDAIMQTLSFNTKKTVCVIGNTYSGKSTLIASLQFENENAKLLKKLRHRLFGVKNISERTAGIEPVSHSSKRYGDVVFVDFAGQHEYHGPHEIVLESIVSKSRSTVTIIVVVKVTEKESAISDQLDRWLHPVSNLASTTSPIRVIVIGSHMDKVKSEAAAKEKLERCYEGVRQSLCDVPLEFQDACYLDCRKPYSHDIVKLCTYLNEVPIPEYKAIKMPYSICWVISRMKTSLDNKAIRVAEFSDWIERNKANLPTNLPPAEEVCEDLSSTGHFLYLPNKEEPSNGWLVLDLPSILHEVYGTLFSPSKKIVNKFGLLNCQKLSDLFTTLDERMVRDVLISLEFCIEVDPSILVEEVTQLTESTDENHEHLFFPALVSSQPPKVFTSSQQGYHTLSWQLLVNKKPFISPRLLQTIILRLAAHHVFHYKRGPDTREHYCSVWSTGIFWQSTKDVDVAVQITDNSVVEVIGRSEVGSEALCSYVATITQDIFTTIRELSPTLSATAYIIHPADPQVLLENPRSPSPQEMFPVEVILESTMNDGRTCLSCKAENKTATRKPISDLFSGFVPTAEVLQGLVILSCKCCVCMHTCVGRCMSTLWVFISMYALYLHGSIHM